jgi:Cell division protein
MIAQDKPLSAAVRTGRFKQSLQVWCLQHLQALVSSLGQLCRNPLAGFLTASVIGISLALPAGFYVMLENTRRIMSGWEGSVEITTFLKVDVPEEDARELTMQLEKNQNIADVQYISREEALEEYRNFSGFAEALELLENNPLPSLLLIRPRLNALSEPAAHDLIQYLSSLPEVELARFDQQWVRRLNAIILIVQRGIYILATVLGLAVMLIVGNTIHMLIYHRRSEIEIAKLFGATDGFIQRPFLYSGLWYGLCGGLIAWAMISLSLLLIRGPAIRLTELYSSDFSLTGLTWKESLIMMLAAILLGLAGSWLSVRHHLKAIEPA